MPSDGTLKDEVQKLREFVESLRRESDLHRGGSLRCVECGDVDQGERGWRTYLTVDDEVATYCPWHAREEFGDAG